LDELSRKNLVSQKRLQLRELVTKSKSLSSYLTSSEKSSKNETNFRQENSQSVDETAARSESCPDHHVRKNQTMSLSSFLLKNEKQSTGESGCKLSSSHSADQFLALSLNRDLVSQQDSLHLPSPHSQWINPFPKPLNKSQTKGSNNPPAPPPPSVSTGPPSLPSTISSPTKAQSPQSALILRRPSQVTQLPAPPLEQKVVYWEIASYDLTQSFYDSDVFRFSDSSWKLILEKNKSLPSTTERRFNSRGGSGGAVFYNLLLYRFMPSTSFTHHTLTIDCELRIHCDLKSSYRRLHRPSPGKQSSKPFIFPSRSFSLTSPTGSGSSSNPQYNGHFNYISSTELLRFVKDGKLLISAELSLREINMDERS
jgi:hypothetical protein